MARAGAVTGFSGAFFAAVVLDVTVPLRGAGGFAAGFALGAGAGFFAVAGLVLMGAFLAGALAAGRAAALTGIGAFLAGALAAGFAGTFFAAAFAAGLAALVVFADAAGLAFTAGLVVLAPTFG